MDGYYGISPISRIVRRKIYVVRRYTYSLTILPLLIHNNKTQPFFGKLGFLYDILFYVFIYQEREVCRRIQTVHKFLRLSHVVMK